MANTRELGIILGLAGAVLLFTSSRAQAAGGAPVVAGYAVDGDGNIELDANNNPVLLDQAGQVIPTDSSGQPIVTAIAPTAAAQDAQLNALLATIRKFESAGRYDILYGSTKNTYGTDDHPHFLGWPGVVLPDKYCIAAGLPVGCHSDAAGAYQFISTTWRQFQSPESDFSPESQDSAAVNLLTYLGAVDALAAGDVPGAFAAASKPMGWASMPYSNAGQPKANLPQVMAAFQNFGGVVA